MNQLLLYLISSWLITLPPTDEWKEWGLKGKIKSLREYGSNADPRDNKIRVTDKSSYEWIEFTRDGKIASHTIFNGDGEKSSGPKYEYDGEGHRISLSWFAADTVFTKYTYIYNDNEKIEWYEEGKGQSKQKTQYLYDNNGRVIEELHYYKSGSLDYKFKNEFDMKGYLISSTQYGYMDVYKSKTSYTYDEHNNVLTETYSSKDGFMNGTTSYTYEYDKKGNWIKRIKYDRNQQPFFVKERKIEYY